MYFQTTQENSKLPSNLYTTDICSKDSDDESSQISYHSTLSGKNLPYHYHGLSFKDSEEEESSPIQNSLKPPQQETDSENFQNNQEQQHDKTSAKGWDLFATRLWGRLPKGPKVGSTTLTYGITNLLGIDAIEAQEPFIHDNTQTMTLFQSKPVKLCENELMPNLSFNFNEKPFSANYDHISCHSVKSLDDIETEEVTELRRMLKVNQKAFSKAIKDQTTLIHKLQKEQENLLETLRITNKEREEQENLLSNLNISLNQTSQQVEILKSKLLHYKHVFRRCDSPQIPSQSQLCIPDIAPFEVQQVLGEVRVLSRIELAVTIGGDLFLVIDTNKKKHFINTSHIIEMNLNFDNGPSCIEFFLVTVSKGSFLFIIHTDDALKECLKLFQSNFYLKILIKQKLRVSQTFNKPAFLTTQLEDFFGFPICFSNKDNDLHGQITKPLVSNTPLFFSDVPKAVYDHSTAPQPDEFLNPSQSPQLTFNAHMLSTQNSLIQKKNAYTNNKQEDFFPKETHPKIKKSVNKKLQPIAPMSNFSLKEKKINAIGQSVNSCKTLIDKKVEMNKSSANHLQLDQNQRSLTSPLHCHEKTSFNSKHDATVKAKSKTHDDSDPTLCLDTSCLKKNSACPIPKDQWEKKIPLEILEEELTHRVALQSSKSSDSLTDSTDRTYNYAAFLLTESEKP